jgi:glycosyltransferase involved in cell wall biosynthesis
MFPLRAERKAIEPVSFLFVGVWCLRKGCDILVEAVKQVTGICLTHVGAIGDLDFPVASHRFIHLDPVPQPELTRFYTSADAFVLASREDGFGVVLCQALACGLPVICTDRTGGTDLAHTAALAARITVVPAGDVGALASAIAVWRDRLLVGNAFPTLAVADRETLSWSGYGRRHDEELQRST